MTIVEDVRVGTGSWKLLAIRVNSFYVPLLSWSSWRSYRRSLGTWCTWRRVRWPDARRVLPSRWRHLPISRWTWAPPWSRTSRLPPFGCRGRTRAFPTVASWGQLLGGGRWIFRWLADSSPAVYRSRCLGLEAVSRRPRPRSSPGRIWKRLGLGSKRLGFGLGPRSLVLVHESFLRTYFNLINYYQE